MANNMISKVIIHYCVLYLLFFTSSMVRYPIWGLLNGFLFEEGSAFTAWMYVVSEVVLCLVRALLFYMFCALLWRWKHLKHMRLFLVWMVVWFLEIVVHTYGHAIHHQGFLKVVSVQVLTPWNLLSALVTFGIFAWLYDRVGGELFRYPTVLW